MTSNQQIAETIKVLDTRLDFNKDVNIKINKCNKLTHKKVE